MDVAPSSRPPGTVRLYPGMDTQPRQSAVDACEEAWWRRESPLSRCIRAAPAWVSGWCKTGCSCDRTTDFSRAWHPPRVPSLLITFRWHHTSPGQAYHFHIAASPVIALRGHSSRRVRSRRARTAISRNGGAGALAGPRSGRARGGPIRSRAGRATQRIYTYPPMNICLSL